MLEENTRNHFIYLVKERLNNTRRKPCAKEFRPMVEAFFNKVLDAVDKYKSADVCQSVEKITGIVANIAMNTRDYYCLSDTDFTSLKKIFDEINQLYTEALLYGSKSYKEEVLHARIDCINEIANRNHIGMHDCTEKEHENYRDGMLFQNYENLWKVIHRVNAEWNELCSRGFSSKIFYDYWDFFAYARTHGEEMTEDEKFETFMAVLDGKMKFVPVYEYKPACFKPVSNNFNDEIVNRVENSYSKPYRLRQKSESISEYIEAFKN